MSRNQRPLVLTALAAVVLLAPTALLANDAPKITAQNYVRAESDYQMKTYIEQMDNFGRLVHDRKPYDVAKQVTVRGNRDTLYSFGIFDLTSPLTVTLPNPGDRYQSLMVVNQDHSIAAAYGPKEVMLTQTIVGTRYVLLAIRTFMDPGIEADVKAAHELQDKVATRQVDKGRFEVPDWNKEEIEKMRATINVLAATVTDSSKFFGLKDELDPIYHKLGAALGWGGMPAKAATYVIVFPEKNDGKTAYTLTLKDVPVDAFWSVTLYDAEGWMPRNERNAYSFNSVTSKKNEDGSTTIHFGGDSKQPNYFPLVEGWNYLLRLYRPREEVLEGKWKFPEPVEAK
jgi:hypothetical protein